MKKVGQLRPQGLVMRQAHKLKYGLPFPHTPFRVQYPPGIKRLNPLLISAGTPARCAVYEGLPKRIWALFLFENIAMLLLAVGPNNLHSLGEHNENHG
jgi:hypothetical protein